MNRNILRTSLLIALTCPAIPISCSFREPTEAQKEEKVEKKYSSRFYPYDCNEKGYTKNFLSNVRFLHIYDGDTPILNNEDTNSLDHLDVFKHRSEHAKDNVRLFGVDAPELNVYTNGVPSPTLGLQHIYALKSRDFIENNVSSANLYVASDQLTYGRAIAEIRYIPKDISSDNLYNINSLNPQDTWRDLAIDLLSEGLVKVSYISNSYLSGVDPRNFDYINSLLAAQKTAVDAHKGIWSESKEKWFGQGKIFEKNQHMITSVSKW